MLGIQKPGAKKYTGRGVMQAKPLDYKWPGKDGYSVESMEYDYSEGSENGLQAFYRQFGDSSSAVETIDPL